MLSSLRTAALAFFLALSTLAGTQAHAQRVEFRGTAQFYNFTAPCASIGWTGANLFNVRYRPGNVGTNGPASGMNFYDRYYAFYFLRFNGQFERVWRTLDEPYGEAGSIGGIPTNWDSPAMQLRIVTQTPATITPTTTSVQILGLVRNFDGVTGCSAWFDATMLVRR